ncbi:MULTISPECIES: hypothetical protein [unclassified Bradyrhizobium]|uniref:hypothetical protein n=1 Tax=unclassified Bradyrhizobium TaxID=2631580 RepID=UPI0029164D86|nr:MULTISPECIES: hypothetical protein [unclassified Bradyrhizobium]
MSHGLESLVVDAARKQGFKPTADAVRQAVVDLAGAVLSDEGLIILPGKGALSPAHYAAALRAAMPAAFRPLDTDRPDVPPAGNLTMQMRAAVAASRKQALPADWNAVRERYAAGTVTRAHMDAVATTRRQGK